MAVAGLVASVLSASSIAGRVAGGGPPARGIPATPVTEAPDSATAVALAHAQGSRVEVLSDRTEIRTVYAEPRGTMSAELSIRPVRVRQAGGWVASDPTLVHRPDGTVGPKAALVELSFSGGGATAPMARYGRDGKWLAVSWPTALPTPVLAGDTATYAEVLPGVDLMLRAAVDGYAQYLVVKRRGTAVGDVRLGLRAGGVTLRATAAGALEARDAKGAAVFGAPVSEMWDSGSPPRRAVVRVAVDGSSLILKPDRALLADPATVYPVTVDPVWQPPIGPSVWTKVFSGKPGTSYFNGCCDVDGWAKVGQCWNGRNECNHIDEAWSYFQFDTRFLAGKRILAGSSLKARVVYSPSGDWRSHSLFLADWGISEGTTWNNRPQGPGLSSVNVPCVGRSGCNPWADVWFPVDGNVRAGGVSTYYLRAGDGGDQLAWRKYDPWATRLNVLYNTQPDFPADLSTDPPLRAACTWCNRVPYFGGAGIRLKALLSDPDGDMVRAYWRIFYNGRLENDREREGAYKANNEIHDTFVDLSNRNGQSFYWEIYANDGADNRGYSFGTGFTIDQVRPNAKPGVSGSLYQSDNRWHGGVGVPGLFTFDSAGVGDVDHFLWGWSDPPTTHVDADALGGKAVVSIAPTVDGPRDLFVRSVDRAGNLSDATVYHFYVRAGSGPLSQYAFEGSTKDEAFLGDRDGTLGDGATYVAGAVGTALRTGGPDQNPGMTAPSAIRTTGSFSVSVWVKLDQPIQGAVTAVSQEGSVNSGFVLGYRDDGAGGRWHLHMPSADAVARPSDDRVLTAKSAQANVWTHLTGVYDAETRQMRLYVNGELAVSATRTHGFDATGPLLVGRGLWEGAVVNQWPGVLDEVKVYDRALSHAEVAAAVRYDNVQVGQWKMDELAGTTARNAVDGGEMLALRNGASFTGDSDADKLADGGAVGGALRLDGVDDHAATSGPVVRTDQNFTVAAWVNVSRLAGTGGPQTVVGQNGMYNSAFMVQQFDTGWRFMMSDATAPPTPPGWPVYVQSAPNTAAVNTWTHVVASYDATAHRGSLYLNGQLAGAAVGTVPLTGAGPLTVGMAMCCGGAGNAFLAGLVDEVRAYSRVLSVAEIQGLVSRDNVPLGAWKLDGTADGVTPAQRGTLNGAPEWTGGQTAVPDPSDLAVRLNGTSVHVSTPLNVDLTRSFSVAAWAKLDAPGGLRTVVSQDGSRVSGFKLRATPDDKWSFVMFNSDVDGGGGQAEAFGGAAQVGVWTHLVAVHDAAADRMSLYVNGVLAGSVDHTHAWTLAAGKIQIGRGQASSEFFPGAIDDVSVYGRVLFADEVRLAAGRDLTLAHNWTLDEGSGPAAADAVGRRTATLSGGVTRVPGRLGNGVQLNGVDGRVSASGVDVRTDQSFTVTAWVRLARTCEPGPAGSCQLVAVSLDGTGTSKFRLGHVKDTDQYQEGVWIFEMPEADSPGAQARAAVTILPSDMDRWTHLAGVYDKPTNKLWLYVNGTRKGDATLNNPWHATGALQIGRSKAPDQFFPGSVDDVRLYSGPLDDGRLANLYQSYVKQDGPASLPRADAGHWKLDESTGTSAADASGRGLTATLRGGATWTGGRTGRSLKLDGSTGYADTIGPVLDTTRSFSAAAWVVLTPTAAPAAAIVAQDGPRNSSFQLAYRRAEGTWAVVVPGAVDVDNPPGGTVLLASQAAAPWWNHVGMVYDANLRQIRLYLNGVLSAAQVGVTVLAGTGPFTIGRAKRNGQLVDMFPGDIDDVRVFGKALTDGEMRRVHDDVPPALIDSWGFDDGTTRATSWRNNHATATGVVTYPTGISGTGKALGLDGTAFATASFGGTDQRDSFTVAAWANISRKDRTATVLGQDGTRMSSMLLQYRPNLDRWVFGQPERDADSMPLVAAVSGAPVVANRWVHLTGVYDHPAHELRLYVDGVLAGRKTGVAMWVGDGPFTIGRSRYNGTPGELFPGMVDEVRTDLGVVPDDEIARRATPPTP